MARGQTTIDFTLGVVVFIVAILFVFTFVPGILSPFRLAGSEDPALSDRVADSLAQGTLGSPESPHELDRYCTVEFFDGSRSDSPSECRYTGGNLEERLTLDSTQRVNVTLNADRDGDGETELLCWQSEDDADGVALKETGSCGGTDAVTLAAGDDVPRGTSSTVTARRVVSLHGQTVVMEVVVW
jgi:hypothetical protein